MGLLARFQDCEDSDCVVKCRGAEFKVHQSTLCKGSPVLGGCIAGSRAGEKVVVKMHDYRMHTVQALLEFMYCGYYSLGADTVNEQRPECEAGAEAPGTPKHWSFENANGQKNLVAACKFHMNVEIAAGFYEMNSLEELSRRNLKFNLPGVQAEGLAEMARNADRLEIGPETQRIVAGAVSGEMQNEDNKHHFKYLKMSEKFSGFVNEHLECRRKAREAASKRLEKILAARE